MKNGDSIDEKDVLGEQERWASTFKTQRQSIRNANINQDQSSSRQPATKKTLIFIRRFKRGCLVTVVIITVLLAMIFTLALF